jgi:agmatinase|tara:strand:- start:284 stop:1162 length:879 start_codon:yes stop_codon:yes gene_type:complete
MDYKNYPGNFLELTDPQSNFEGSKAVIIPIPYEKTTTFMRGTQKGPAAIIENSVGMQLYDEELSKNICEVGICTLNPLESKNDPEEMVHDIYKATKIVLEKNKLPIALGGEHTITQGCVKAAAEKFDNLSVLQIDAHTDLVDEWEGSKYNHACVGKRCFDITKKMVLVGIRSVSLEEVEFAEENQIKLFWAKDMHDNDGWQEDAISRLSENVYITVDLDGLDPSFVPSVGNPEPGGLGYYQTLKFLRKVCKEKNVVGFDVVELCPNEKEVSSDLTAVKIIYKLIGYVFENKK